MNQKQKFPNTIDKFDGRNAATVFLMAVFAPVAVQFVFVVILGLFVEGDILEYAQNNAWLNWVLTALTQFAFITVFFMYCNKQKINPIRASKIDKRLNILQVLLLIAISICLFFVFDPFVLLFEQLLKVLGYKSPEFPLGDFGTVGAYIAGIFVVCLLPAVGEELVFRGAVTNGFLEYGKKRAIFLTGLCFALMHQNPDQTVHQFLLGCLLAWILLETGSLRSVMLIHFVNNFTVVSLQFLYIGILKQDIEAQAAALAERSFADLLGESVLTAIVFIPLLIGLLYLLTKTKKKEAVPEAPPEQEIKVKIFKLPFADILSPGQQGEEARVKEVEGVVKQQAEKWMKQNKIKQKKAAFTALFFGLGYCLLMWILAFIGVG